MTVYKDVIIDQDVYGSTMFIGRYGEDILFSPLPDGTYIVSSLILGLFDIVIKEESKPKIFYTYIREGHKDFDIHNKNVTNRLYYLGTVLEKLYLDYEKTKDRDTFITIKQLLLDVEIFKLSKTDYIDFFITYGSDEHWDYINAILNLRKEILSSATYAWEVYLDNEKNERFRRYKFQTRTKREAIRLAKKQFKKELKCRGALVSIKQEDEVYKGEILQ